MGAGHNHSHAPAGALATTDFRRKLSFVLALTGTVLIAQIIGTIWTGSLALLTDTVHMAVDTSGLTIALIAAILMQRPASAARTWGFRRIEVLAAMVQAMVLLGVGAYAAYEGISRLSDPPEIPGPELLIFGVVGLTANIVALWIIARDRRANMNMRAAFLEVLADALGSVGVIVAAVVITTTGWQQADALAGLFIAAMILPRAIVLLRDTSRVLMEFTPIGLDLDQVKKHILELDHVRDVHDLHASTVATGLPVLSAHVIVDDECFQDGHAPEILAQLKACVAEHFDVEVAHSTFQVETASVAKGEVSCAS